MNRIKKYDELQKTNLLEIKPFKQSDDSLCGPAVIKMVLNYYGKEVEESEIAELCNHTYELGTDDFNMKKAVEILGFKVIIKNDSTFEDIQYWLDREIPVIVDWFSPGAPPDDISLDDMPNGHSSIVVGMDSKFIHLMDPEGSKHSAAVRKINKNDFLRVWFDFRPNVISSWEDMVIRQIFVILPQNCD
jgi:ABC-type bacteriocin/lantibiotic exporter with double-glycine peptidase domain